MATLGQGGDSLADITNTVTSISNTVTSNSGTQSDAVLLSQQNNALQEEILLKLNILIKHYELGSNETITEQDLL